MKKETLQKIKENITTGNQTMVTYSELQQWYDLSVFEFYPDPDTLCYITLTIEGEEYWLTIDSDTHGVGCEDEIITKEDTGALADWLFNRN